MKTKTLVAMAALALLVALPARAAEVVSSNVVGYSKLTLNGNDGYTMIANPFVEVGTGDLIGIDEMFSEDLVAAQAGTGVSSADNVLVWNGQGYDTFYFRKPRSGSPYWVDSAGSASAATQLSLPEGAGAFYVSRSTTNKVMTISGEVRADDQTLKILPGYNLLENPFPAPISFETFEVDGAIAGAGVSAADNILVWNGTGYTTYYYRKPRTGSPYWVNSAGSASSATTETIAPYTGFFYVSRAETGFFEVTVESPLSE